MSAELDNTPTAVLNQALIGRSTVIFMVVILILVLCFEGYFLGIGAAVVSAILFLFPLFIGLRTFGRSRRASVRESTYFAILLVAAVLGAIGYAAGLMQVGQHHVAASQRKLREFNAAIRGDDRFHNLGTSVSTKCVFINGTVDTGDELRYLERLAESKEFDLTLMMNVKVRGDE